MKLVKHQFCQHEVRFILNQGLTTFTLLQLPLKLGPTISWKGFDCYSSSVGAESHFFHLCWICFSGRGEKQYFPTAFRCVQIPPSTNYQLSSAKDSKKIWLGIWKHFKVNIMGGTIAQHG